MRLKLKPRQKCIYIVLCLSFLNIANIKCLADVTDDHIFANMDYMVGGEHSSQKITLVDGKYVESRIRYVDYTGYYVYGNFNKDGLQDAAVVLTDSGGGSAEWFDLAFLIKEGDKFVHKSTVYLGDRVEINSVTEKDGKVVIDMYMRDKENWAYQPRKRLKNVYEYIGPTVWGSEYQTLVNNS